MNGIFIVGVVVGLVMYIFYKVKAFRTKLPAQKRWLQTKANIALGAFIASFGINLFFGIRGWVDVAVGTIFVLLGLFNIIYGTRAYKHYYPYVVDEMQQSAEGKA
ncbi:YtpI-like protein [Salsuginibacillus halophilus]|uniref:YtpI-like protein n=1 Tax=Salsuginibacillus halophilus TaxID=517424 RepID=A0A2P8HCY2_9BACI|nr:YtpI family protein [Salsuginibacillus halophilus]PSL44086.1 YtpI-like protein [Salsuginibacillus halophilus]